ncbi:hypothetical protein IJI55_00540 [Candidatus Saccharibacteria bacterium]|nr:hypothetical protein [Candidatus Saccharibacteria bacterium]
MKWPIIKNQKLRTCLVILFALFFTIAIDRYFFPDQRTINTSVLCVFSFAISIYFQLLSHAKKYQKFKTSAFFLSLLFSISLVVGRAVYDTSSISPLLGWGNTTLAVINIIGFTTTFTALLQIVFRFFSVIEKRLDKSSLPRFMSSKKAFYLLWLIFFLGFVPAFIAHFPGILSYDYINQTEQALSGLYTTHHPPLHTFIWSICLHLGEAINVYPTVIYEIIQACFISFVFASIIKFLINRRINKYIIYVSIIFFLINPAISVFSLTMTKDVFFSGFLALFILEITKLISSPKEYLSKKPNIILYGLFVVGTCLFRNNAIYIFIVFTPILIILSKNCRKKIAIISIFPIVLYLFGTFSVNKVFHIQNGSPGEMLSVPMQQIADVLYNDEYALTDDQKASFSEYIPIEKVMNNYNPRISDPIKGYFDGYKVKDNLFSFIKLWAKIGLQYPVNYISAFLSLNLPSWYPDAYPVDIYHPAIYIENRIQDDKSQSIVPVLYDYYSIVSQNGYRDIPLVSTFFSISTCIWVVLLSLFSALSRGCKKSIIALLPIILLWLTYLLGPVSIFRYYYPIMILYPLFLVIIIQPKKLFLE